MRVATLGVGACVRVVVSLQLVVLAVLTQVLLEVLATTFDLHAMVLWWRQVLA